MIDQSTRAWKHGYMVVRPGKQEFELHSKSVETNRTCTHENMKKLHGLGSVSAGLHAYRITAVAAR